MGLDVAKLLGRATHMMHAVRRRAGPGQPRRGPGDRFGRSWPRGRDKVTFVVPAAAALGMWSEQLIAESTGKEGTGLLPVAGEKVGDPSLYGSDRVFAYFRLAGEVEEPQEQAVALKARRPPVVTIEMADRLDLAREFLRWEIATATAGAILGINAFNQPNVQESKDNTKRLLAQQLRDILLFGKENIPVRCNKQGRASSRYQADNECVPVRLLEKSDDSFRRYDTFNIGNGMCGLEDLDLGGDLRSWHVAILRYHDPRRKKIVRRIRYRFRHWIGRFTKTYDVQIPESFFTVEGEYPTNVTLDEAVRVDLFQHCAKYVFRFLLTEIAIHMYETLRLTERKVVYFYDN